MLTPFKVPAILTRLYPSLEWSQKTTEDTVFLTFDDGPNPEVTPWVLEELQKFNAKGTFFCVGENAVKYPAVVEQVLSGGHSIGNHTFNHLKGWSVSNDIYVHNVEMAAENTSRQLFRPPYGRIRRKQSKLIAAKGFRIVMWSLLSCDYLPNLNKEKSLRSLLRNSKPGSIVVFHDSIKASKNMQWILPRYLAAMNERGFTFAAL